MSNYISGLQDLIKSGFKKSPEGIPTHWHKYKTRFSMLGTVGSGKTTFAAGLVLTAQILSGQLQGFKCRVLEGPTDILGDASRLSRGRFPKKTPVNTPTPPEAGLLMLWDGVLGQKKIHIPICDVAGENVQRMIKRYSGNLQPTADAWRQTTELIKYVLDADGFILVVPASRALLFHEDAQIEPEPEDCNIDPDVNIHRILESVMFHKEQHGGKKIKGIAVIITKWDMIAPYAKNWGMDLYDTTGAGLEKFMQVCFRGTSMALKAYGLDNVRFFPSHFQVQRDQQGNLVKWSDKDGYKIEVIQEKRVPKFSESSFVAAIDFLKTFAA